jgi:RiboL-PSP-HEPN
VSVVEHTAVDRLYNEVAAIIDSLHQGNEVSLEVAAGDHARKILVLACASYFEQRVCGSVLEFVRERARGSAMVENLVRNKAIARQYHTWFKWEQSNANQFFGLFGSEFKATMSELVDGSKEMQGAVRAFLELGNERNRLVHQDFATFPMEKTLKEIYELYQSALMFVEALPKELRRCDAGSAADFGPGLAREAE